jgi:hypothetical protein
MARNLPSRRRQGGHKQNIMACDQSQPPDRWSDLRIAGRPASPLALATQVTVTVAVAIRWKSLEWINGHGLNFGSNMMRRSTGEKYQAEVASSGSQF